MNRVPLEKKSLNDSTKYAIVKPETNKGRARRSEPPPRPYAGADPPTQQHCCTITHYSKIPLFLQELMSVCVGDMRCGVGISCTALFVSAGSLRGESLASFFPPQADPLRKKRRPLLAAPEGGCVPCQTIKRCTWLCSAPTRKPSICCSRPSGSVRKCISPRPRQSFGCWNPSSRTSLRPPAQRRNKPHRKTELTLAGPAPFFILRQVLRCIPFYPFNRFSITRPTAAPSKRILPHR